MNQSRFGFPKRDALAEEAQLRGVVREATAKVTPRRVNDRRAATWRAPTAPRSASSFCVADT